VTDSGVPTPAGGGVDLRAAGIAAAITLGIAAVPIAVVRLVVGSHAEGGERSLWVGPVVALFVAFAVGGHTAAKGHPAAPYRQAATSAALAFAVFIAFTVARRLLTGDGFSFPLVVTLAVLFQIAVSLALLGGYVAWRQSR